MAIASSGANVQALSRSLDKVFDEAQLTGLLSLNGRNLKDFPNVASRYDLTDTVEVDLSKNRFTEFPVQISEFVSLETLYLYHNCIRSIPIAVQYLDSLTHLDLSRNQLQCIPACLCTLPLEVLLLENNRLNSLPKEICRLSDTLMELDVSCNKLEELPTEIGDLKKLRVLNARENLLSELPFEFCKLKLQVLDVSSNRISQLNVDLRHMISLVRFDLNHNPLVFPPAKLCNSGRVHVFKALEVAFVKQTKRQGLSNEQDFQRKCQTLKSNPIRLIPTDPEDFKYVLNPKTERRKNRHHTVAADSGYSTLTDDTSKSLRDISDVHLRKRSPPVGEEAPAASSRRRFETDLRVNSSNLMSFSMYDNCATKDLASGSVTKTSMNGVGSDCRAGSFVEEVMSACMERIQSSSLSSGSFATDNKSPLQQKSSLNDVQHHQSSQQNKDDEVTRELWRQREEYLNRKKRAGLLRMEVLQDAGESMLSPSVSNGVDMNCNNCNGGTYNLEHAVSHQKPYMSHSWTAIDKRGTSTLTNNVSSTPVSSVITEENSSLSSYDISELTPSPSEPPSFCPIPVQQVISSVNDSVSFCSNNASCAPIRSSLYSSNFTKEKAFSPPRSVRSEVIQSIYNGTASSPSRYSATNGGTCEARPLTEQHLAVYSLESAIDHAQPSNFSVLTRLQDEQSKEIDSQLNSVANGSVDVPNANLKNGEQDNRIKKRVNVIDSVPKKLKETGSISNGRGSLSSSQSSVSSSSSSSRAKTAGNKASGLSTVNGAAAGGVVNGGCVSNVRKSSSATNAPLVKQPPPVPAKSIAAAASAVNPGKRRTSVSNRQVSVFSNRCAESMQNGTSSHLVHSNSLAQKVSDSVERQQQNIDEMRKALEEKLNLSLPLDHAQLAETLSDGVHLCNYLNILRPKTVRSVHMPSDAVPKLTLAKRNVENFLTGCRRLAIPESHLFAIADVVDKKNLVNIGRTVNFITKQLINHSKPKSPTHPTSPDHGMHSATSHVQQHRTSQRMTKV